MNFIRSAAEEKQNPSPPDFRTVTKALLGEARELWDQGDDQKILMLMSNQDGLIFVHDNCIRLRAKGTYEDCLIDAYTRCKVNWQRWNIDELYYLFELADREKLRNCGDPIPSQETFLLYRGVAGKGRSRKVRSLSWTSNPSCAAWFAMRFDRDDPAVFSVSVRREEILCYLGESFGDEDEYLIFPENLRHKKVKPFPDHSVYEEQRSKWKMASDPEDI